MGFIKTNTDYNGKDINLLTFDIATETLFYKNFGGRVVSAIKSKYYWIEVGNNFQFQASVVCPTTGFNDVTMNQRAEAVCEIMMIGQIDKNVLVATVREFTQKKGAKNDNILDDTALMNAIMENLIETAANQLDDIILNGNTATGVGYLGLCNGFLRKWQVAGGFVPVTAVPANLVAATVASELQKLITAAPKALKSTRKYKAKFAVSNKIAEAYKQYLNGLVANIAYITEEAPLRYAGYDIVELGYLPDDVMFFTYPENLMLAMDDQNDPSDWKIVDLGLSTLCERIQMQLKVRIGVATGYINNVVLYI